MNESELDSTAVDETAVDEQLLRRVYESVVVHANDAVLVCAAGPLDEPDGPRIIYANPAFTRMTGYSASEILGKTPRILQSRSTDRDERDRVAEALRLWKPVEADLLNVRKDGTEFWVQISIAPVADDSGWFTHWVAIQRNITARKRRELAVAAMLDGTTDLVMTLDEHGTVVGASSASDKTLGTPARTMVGHEFVSLVHPEDVDLATAIIAPVHGIRLTRNASAELRLRHLDDKWRWYDITLTDIGDDVRGDVVVSCVDITATRCAGELSDERGSSPDDELRHAIEAGHIGLVFQPLVDLTTRAIMGVEALARWNHPTRGTIMPGDFIDRAEATGLMNQLGEWVLDVALRDVAARRRRPGSESMVVWVNMSTSQVQSQGVLVTVDRLLRAHGLPGSALGLEITESVLKHDIGHARATLRALRDMGVALAIDDFGTGYSSLSYLAELPIDTVKIDRSFVHGLDTTGSGRESVAIIRAVIGIADALDLQVVAEGIETREQADRLVELGCRYGQGRFLGPASPSGAPSESGAGPFVRR